MTHSKLPFLTNPFSRLSVRKSWIKNVTRKSKYSFSLPVNLHKRGQSSHWGARLTHTVLSWRNEMHRVSSAVIRSQPLSEAFRIAAPHAAPLGRDMREHMWVGVLARCVARKLIGEPSDKTLSTGTYVFSRPVRDPFSCRWVLPIPEIRSMPPLTGRTDGGKAIFVTKVLEEGVFWQMRYVWMHGKKNVDQVRVAELSTMQTEFPRYVTCPDVAPKTRLFEIGVDLSWLGFC